MGRVWAMLVAIPAMLAVLDPRATERFLPVSAAAMGVLLVGSVVVWGLARQRWSR